MLTDLHEHYRQLTDDERRFVDQGMNTLFLLHNEFNDLPALPGDDRAERVVDAIARWIIESRAY